MSTGSPSAYLLWAILSCIFLGFLILHLWLYDRFSCLKWDSGRQPGAFKRVMTYSYLATLPLLVAFSVSMTVLKYQEGYTLAKDGRIAPRYLSEWSPQNRRYLLPLFFALSVSWSLELVTHLEELTFWLFLLHQGPGKRDWFHSWEFRTWYTGSIIAVLGMPVTTVITRHQVNTTLGWIFLAGSVAGTSTTVCFLYVLLRFPGFLEYVKAEGAEPDVVVRLATFYQLNCIRVVFRFFFTLPLLLIAADSIMGPYPIVSNPFASDFLLMIGGMGCFISSGITLLIFFPRSFAQESGHRAKALPHHTIGKVPTSTSSAPPEYYYHHYPHERAISDPISVLNHSSEPPSAIRMNSFRFPDDRHYLHNHCSRSSRPPRRRQDSAGTGDISVSYDSDVESLAPTPQTMQGGVRDGHPGQPHPLQHSISQPSHSRRPSNNNSGTKSDDTVWDALHFEADRASSSKRRHSDGPFIYHRNGKIAKVNVGGRPSQEPLQPTRRTSQLHPYLVNFTSPIDLMDERDSDDREQV